MPHFAIAEAQALDSFIYHTLFLTLHINKSNQVVIKVQLQTNLSETISFLQAGSIINLEKSTNLLPNSSEDCWVVMFNGKFWKFDCQKLPVYEPRAIFYYIIIILAAHKLDKVETIPQVYDFQHTRGFP